MLSFEFVFNYFRLLLTLYKVHVSSSFLFYFGDFGCIICLLFSSGGAAITCKNKLETIDEENLKEVSSQIRQAFVPDSTSANVLGMDWSKRLGQSEAPSFVNDFSDQPVVDSESFIVVHGAG